MAYLSNPVACCKSPEIITAGSTSTDAAGWREFWRTESHRCGTDWTSLLEAADQVLRKLRVLHVGAPSS